MKKKVYVIILNKKGEISLEKGKFVHPLVIKLRDRIVIKTTDPYIYKKKECYFVYDIEPHTFDIKTGKIISDEIFEIAKQFSEKYKITLLSTTIDPEMPEDLTPHLATEKILGLLIQESLTKNFLKSFLTFEREQIISNLLYVALGFLIGLIIGIGFRPAS